MVAGPFADRIDADWAALSGGLPAVSVHGIRRADGGVTSRPSPEERAFLGELGEQLDRLPHDWDDLLTDTDPLTTLVVEVAAALLEAGLPLHDDSQGGVCLLPETGVGGVLVSWRAHDRMSVHDVRGVAADRDRRAVDERRRRRHPLEPGVRGGAVRRDRDGAGDGPTLTAAEVAAARCR